MSIGPFNKEDLDLAARQDRREADRTLRFALDTARAELYKSRMEVLRDFIDQVSETGKIVINPGTPEQYTYDFHGCPWIEKEYISRELYALKIKRLKEIISDQFPDCEGLSEPTARS